MGSMISLRSTTHPHLTAVVSCPIPKAVRLQMDDEVHRPPTAICAFQMHMHGYAQKKNAYAWISAWITFKEHVHLQMADLFSCGNS